MPPNASTSQRSVAPPSDSIQGLISRSPARVRLKDGPIGLAEADGVEVLDGTRPVDLDEEAARVAAVATGGGRLLDDHGLGAGVVRGDRGGGARGAEPDDDDIGFGGHLGRSVLTRVPPSSLAAVRIRPNRRLQLRTIS